MSGRVRAEPTTHDRAAPALPEFACPRHGERLERRPNRLACPRGDAFDVAGGIPRFVDDVEYTAAFGVQWNRYRLTQLDSYTGLLLSRDRLRRCLGEELWESLPTAAVLECGCGAGRFTEVLLTQGASVASVDLSGAVEANARNFPIGENHHIAQADILALPFEPESFDVVLCLGVVQHTRDPEATIRALYDQVAPGGSLVLDHYTYRLAWFLSSSPLVRAYLRRLPPEQGLRYTEALVERLWPLHSRGRRLRTLLNRVSPVVTYFKLYPQLTDEQQREWALLDTHDSLTDYYKRFRTRSSIERTLRRLGLVDVEVWRGGNGIEARARRPPA